MGQRVRKLHAINAFRQTEDGGDSREGLEIKMSTLFLCIQMYFTKNLLIYQESRKRRKTPASTPSINDLSVVIPLPVAQLTPSSSSTSSGASSASSSSTSSGSFCGSPAGAESSSDAGFYEMTGEEIDTTTAEAEDFMQFQVRNKVS